MSDTGIRAAQLAALQQSSLDVLIMGGGINGAGVLRDLSLRARTAGAPLRVGLVERHHFSSGTSGKNSQLIHGGLRYLKYMQIRLVREALHERATLLKIAPHLVKPLPFLLPMYSVKDRLLYNTGLWVYDLLAGAAGLGKHRMLCEAEAHTLEPGLNTTGMNSAALFFDAQVHSARLVLENILNAVEDGAIAVNYVDLVERQRTGDQWSVRLRDTLTGDTFEVNAKEIVDATGAWTTEGGVRRVRGSHLVLPRVNGSDNAIAYFEEAGRIVFVMPWGSQRQLTLLGTTDVDHQGSVESVHISQEETDYLLRILWKLYPAAKNVEVISSYSSLRPLIAESGSATAASREHRIRRAEDGVVQISGGKYTTYRAMSEQASDLICDRVAPNLKHVHQTADTPLRQHAVDLRAEMVQHLRDYLYVSTYLGYEQRWTAETLRPYAEEMAAVLGWDEARIAAEIDDVLTNPQ